MTDEVFERVTVVRCPKCKNEHMGADNNSTPITVIESADHVYALRFTDEGELDLSWYTTTDGMEDYRFLCNGCGYEWDVPSCFSIEFG